MLGAETLDEGTGKQEQDCAAHAHARAHSKHHTLLPFSLSHL